MKQKIKIQVDSHIFRRIVVVSITHTLGDMSMGFQASVRMHENTKSTIEKIIIFWPVEYSKFLKKFGLDLPRKFLGNKKFRPGDVGNWDNEDFEEFLKENFEILD